jgi:predicted ATPase
MVTENRPSPRRGFHSALELAAARVKVLNTDQILQSLVGSLTSSRPARATRLHANAHSGARLSGAISPQ